MKFFLKFFLKYFVRVACAFVLIELALPFAVGVYYNCTGDRPYEQQWLDRAILYLKVERDTCNNPERKEALDYTIKNYSRIGGFCVMVMPLFGNETGQTEGVNLPWVPGLTLDPSVLHLPLHLGAMILVHESMHDGWFNLHPFIDAKMKRIGCL